MKREDFKFLGPSGFELQGRYWKTDQAPVATIMGVHGYSEYSLQYEPLVEYFLRHGFDIFWFDLPGHGQSSGRRSNIDDFQDYILSLEAFIESTASMRRISNMKLFGHSLGGLISLRFLQTSAKASLFSSVALSSPFLGVAMYGPRMMKFLKFLTVVLPNLTLPNEGSLGASILTHDESRIQRRLADPLIQSQVTVHWFREFLKVRELVFADILKIRNPVAIFQSGDERVVSREESERFFALMKNRKHYKVYEGWYHELANEIDREIFFQDLLNWYSQ